MGGPAEINWKDNIETLKVELEFLTPMFGGGPESHRANAPHIKEPDPYTPVRSATFRGALRYWWRATSGAWCESIKKMHEREAEIFGSTKNSGAVALWVDSRNIRLRSFQFWERKTSKNGNVYFVPENQWQGIGYGAFPLTQVKEGSANDDQAGNLYDLINTFKVSLRYPATLKLRGELELALSALVHFGGLGGRTTRGFGQIAEVKEKAILLSREAIFQKLREKGTGHLKSEVPAISTESEYYVHKPNSSNDGVNALNAALNALRTFRQGEKVGRREGQDNKNRNKLGRSYWPEPDTIRRKLQPDSRKRHPDHQTPVNNVDTFVRGNFGLPIIFKFLDGREPPSTTLKLVDKERMRSPLQISVHRDGYSFLLMTAPRVDQLQLVQGKEKWPVELTITENERQQLASQGGQSRALFAVPSSHGDYDVLDAFLQYVRKGS